MRFGTRQMAAGAFRAARIGTLGVLLVCAPGRLSDPLSLPEPHACRFWGLIGGGYPADLIARHLRDGPQVSLKDLGQYNSNGWGCGYFPADTAHLVLNRALSRRGEPPANHAHDRDYDLAVGEMAALRPRAALANVRLTALRHGGIPDPYPLQRAGWSFALAGHITDTARLREELVTEQYLADHPPHYSGAYLDGELLLLYILRLMEENPGPAAAVIRQAARGAALLGEGEWLDFLLTDGDTLYAVCGGGGKRSPLHYCGDGNATPYWVVATAPVGGDPAGWIPIAQGNLAVFVPGTAPRLIALGDSLSAGGTSPATALQKTHCWALIGSGYGEGLIGDQLRDAAGQSLKDLADPEGEGWGLTAFLGDAAAATLAGPIIRRGGPPADDPRDPGFDLAAEEMQQLRVRAAVGHVRQASSGHLWLPDPHPFVHEGFLFAHNGTVNTAPLLEYLLDDDAAYLERHPPDYHRHPVSGGGMIDSELYFLYLLKYLSAHPQLARAEALRAALRELAAVTGTRRLNFVMTAGDTLYALRYNDPDGVVYFPAGPYTAPKAAPSYWAVASQPLGDGSPWARIAEKTLAVFVPGELPQFLPIHAGPDPRPGYSFGAIEISGVGDHDQDGWFSRLRVCCDPDVEWGTASVALRLLFSARDTVQTILGPTPSREITGIMPDAHCVDVVGIPDSLGPTRWDLTVELYATGAIDPVAVATPQTHPAWGLSGIAVEGSRRDSVPDLPLEFSFAWIDCLATDDRDGDGFARALDIAWDADLSGGGDSARVSVKVYGFDQERYFALGESAAYLLRGSQADTTLLHLPITPENRPPATWELVLQLYDVTAAAAVAYATGADFAQLAQVAVEGALQDQPPDRPTGGVGSPRPSPATAAIAIPVVVPAAGAWAALGVYDVSGRRLRSDAAAWLESGERQVVWDGCDAAGRPVPAGCYILAVRVGSRVAHRRCMMLR